MKIGLFGGSFNPVHNGHLRLADDFRGYLLLDRIVIMPANIPPHKTDKAFASADDRYNMCELGFDDSFFEVSRLEIDRGGKSFTLDTVTELRRIYDGAEIFLLVGSDMLLYFDRWFRYEEILKLCTLCAVSRRQDEDYDMMRAFARETLGDAEDKIIIMKSSPYELTSTAIRGMLSAGEDISGYVPERVKDYIESRGLYK